MVTYEPHEFGLTPEDIRLLYFLAEYGYIYIRNIENIYPSIGYWSLVYLKNRNYICSYENAIYLGDAGVKFCADRLHKWSIPVYGIWPGDIRKNQIFKIASEFAREEFTVSEHDPSDYMFLQSREVKGEHYGLSKNSSVLGLVIGTAMRAGVFYYSKHADKNIHRQVSMLRRIGVTTIILLKKENTRMKEVYDPIDGTQFYYIPRSKKGYAKIKSLISPRTQTGSIIPD